MSIYGKILFDHQNFQDLISSAPSSNTRVQLANQFLTEDPLKSKFDSKVDKIEGQRLITEEEVTKLANLNNYDDSEVNKNISIISSALANEIERSVSIDEINSDNIDEIFQILEEVKDTYATASELDEVRTIADAAQTAEEVSNIVDTKITALNLDTRFDEDYDIKGAAAIAEVNAKNYTDKVKKAILGENISETFDTLVEIQEWINNKGVDATEFTLAIANEASIRKRADDALDTRISDYENTKNTYATISELNSVSKVANAAPTSEEVNEIIKSSIEQEASQRIEIDNNINAQLSQVNNSLTQTRNTLNNLINSSDKLTDIENLLESLKSQLEENDGLTTLLIRLQQLENILYSNNLIIGEIDENI